MDHQVTDSDAYALQKPPTSCVLCDLIQNTHQVLQAKRLQKLQSVRLKRKAIQLIQNSSSCQATPRTPHSFRITI